MIQNLSRLITCQLVDDVQDWEKFLSGMMIEVHDVIVDGKVKGNVVVQSDFKKYLRMTITLTWITLLFHLTEDWKFIGVS